MAALYLTYITVYTYISIKVLTRQYLLYILYQLHTFGSTVEPLY